jgi:GDP-fucose protein O-fucosyltransferase
LIQKTAKVLANISTTIFIATNAQMEDKITLKKTLSSFRIVYLEDLLPTSDPLRDDLDSIDLSILDQYLCMHSDHFVGNLYSSFSRAIIESRSNSSGAWSVF